MMRSFSRGCCLTERRVLLDPRRPPSFAEIDVIHTSLHVLGVVADETRVVLATLPLKYLGLASVDTLLLICPQSRKLALCS